MDFRVLLGIANQTVIVTPVNRLDHEKSQIVGFTLTDHNIRANEVAKAIDQLSNFIDFNPHKLPSTSIFNVAVVVMFKTKTGSYVLGHLKLNQALIQKKGNSEKVELKTDDNKSYPKQICLATEGYFGDQTMSIRDGAINLLNNKLFMRIHEVENLTEKEGIMPDFQSKLKENNGWKEEISFRRQTWSEEGECGIATCFTVVKSINCTDEFVAQVKSALPTYMPKVVREKQLSGVEEFDVFDFNRIKGIDDSYKKLSEIEKVRKAYTHYGSEPVLMRHDEKVNCLEKIGAFK